MKSSEAKERSCEAFKLMQEQLELINEGIKEAKKIALTRKENLALE